MPFDGTYSKNILLFDLLNKVRTHLSNKERWMKQDLTDGRNRFCLVGAIMHYSINDPALTELAIRVVAKQVNRKYEAQSPSARLMRYNDAKTIHHHHVIRTLDRALQGVNDAGLSKR